MHHPRFSRRYLWVVSALLSFSFITTPALAEKQVRKKGADQSEPDTTTEGKPEKKKKTEKEKKPQLLLLGSKITYSAPRRWTKPQISSRGKLEALQFVIPLPSSESPSRTTSAIVVAEPNADNLSLTDFSNKNLPRKYPAATIVADQLDGDSWRTVVSHVHEANPPYTVLDRFGVAAGIRVHFRIIFPKEDDAKASWPQTLMHESNDFVRNLRINEKNYITAELIYDKGSWGLHEGKVSGKSAVADASGNKGKTTKKAEVKKAVHKPVVKKKENPAPVPDSAEEHEL